MYAVGHITVELTVDMDNEEFDPEEVRNWDIDFAQAEFKKDLEEAMNRLYKHDDVFDKYELRVNVYIGEEPYA